MTDTADWADRPTGARRILLLPGTPASDAWLLGP
jgi:hypothetical protein